MRENIEIPNRGYETRDVEAMSRALAAAENPRGAGRVLGVVLVCAAVIAGVLFLAVR